MPAYSDMSIRDWYSQIEEILGDVLEHQDFSMQTWLALGAASQLFALAWLPSSFSFWLPLAWLAYRLMRTALDSWNVYHSRLWSRVMQGQWMGQLPEPEKLSEASETSEGVVMFLLGARLNHPLGKLGPGAVQVNEVFNDMWREAEQNSSKWGYLGRTATLVDFSDTERAPTIWISYWKDLKGLQKFSEGAAHRLGQNMYNSKKLPFVGIMHETYYAPKGCWETIYDNMPPWGLGKCTAKIPAKGDSRDAKPFPVLTPSPKGSTMFRRMGRAVDGAKLTEG
ncbi:MAG: hypothetical protein LQ342_008346 [Letrouitia transgressa]|nr:MAG: hypothetical protein LQ342_008346 [Letrouitia transgressa]